MTENVQAIRLQLEQRRAEIRQQQEDTRDGRDPVALDQTSVGRLSRMDALQTQQMALAAQRQRQEELNRIDAALVRLAEGNYGVCIVCEEDIAPRRLAFDPAIATCVTCASGRSKS